MLQAQIFSLYKIQELGSFSFSMILIELLWSFSRKNDLREFVVKVTHTVL